MSQGLAPQIQRTEYGWWPDLPKDWRDSTEYTHYRTQILERDGYTCQGCGITEAQCRRLGGWLECAHIYAAELIPTRCLDPSNALTSCHFPGRNHPTGIAGGNGCHRPGGLAMHFGNRPAEYNGSVGAPAPQRNGRARRTFRGWLWHHLIRDPLYFIMWTFCMVAVWGWVVKPLYVNYPTDTPSASLSWFGWQALWSGLGGAVLLASLILAWRHIVVPGTIWAWRHSAVALWHRAFPPKPLDPSGS